ncbi:hypothetical protein [Fructilactobacillus fructivorans]|uniref:Uncharacterized protein n=1 Tax=Fructilactobacillus fructivorans TaxID=1614 RepID=A0AAE6TVZ1_9LACO|nr:hypothetical protein [Fructilactobacillus fructivorans]QFX92172.1 hypothetical protein LF543_00620 [Fructilactobacillus fructivorans]RDV65221.1 hypothetical protein DXU76_04360 [Fructilactobacillus fructivorans]
MKKSDVVQKLDFLYVLTLIIAIVETVLLFPILGGIIIVSMLWVPLLVLLGLYITCFIISSQMVSSLDDGKVRSDMLSIKPKFIVGIILSVVAVIPIVGWVSHIIMAIIMWQVFTNISTLKTDLIDNDESNGEWKDVTPDSEKEQSGNHGSDDRNANK